MLAAALAGCGSSPPADGGKPKYGPRGRPLAAPLSRAHEYLRSLEHPAPDFWALIPYYAAQRNELSCSTATIAMLLNAARAGADLAAAEPLVTQEDLLARVRILDWRANVEPPGGRGVTLDELARLVEASFAAHGQELASLRVVRFEDASPRSLAELRAILAENERSAADVVAVNFLQSACTDDAPAGHIAPVGAYDEAGRRVLILDPDREWYEPYWVADETLLAAMATVDPLTGRPRGLVWARRGKIVPGATP